MRTLLVVDDEPDIRELLRISLEVVGGHRVVACADADAAVDALAAGGVDGVLLDVHLGGADGRDVLARLRTCPGGASVPVAFLTASVLDGQVASLAALNVRGVLRKPFDPMALPDEVARTFGWAA